MSRKWMSWKIILDWIFSGLKAIEETYGEIGDTILNTHLFYSLKRERFVWRLFCLFASIVS